MRPIIGRVFPLSNNVMVGSPFTANSLPPELIPTMPASFEPGPARARPSSKISFYQTIGAVPAAYVDLLTTPDDLVPQLRQAHFQEWSGAVADLMLYVGPDEALPTTLDAEVVVASAPAKEAWASLVAEEDTRDAHAQARLKALYRAQISDPRMAAFLIRVAGIPASRCQLFSWQGLGRIEALRTRAAYPGRGLAAAVVRKALNESLRQNHITYIYAEPGSNGQRLYHRLGFRTVAQNAIRGFVWQGQLH